MVYSDPVDITGCYQTRPKNPSDTLTLSVRESDHKIIIYTTDAPANVLAFGKYETVFKCHMSIKDGQCHYLYLNI